MNRIIVFLFSFCLLSLIFFFLVQLTAVIIGLATGLVIPIQVNAFIAAIGAGYMSIQAVK